MRKEDWKNEHLSRKHNQNFIWCPLCVARAKGEANPLRNLVPPQQDPSQIGMDYLKENYNPDSSKYYGDVIEKGVSNDNEIIEKE